MMAGTGEKQVELEEFLDNLPISRFHIAILALCTILTAIDGYEIFVVGWVLPKLAEDFNISPAAVTPVMIAQQIGMVVGLFTIPQLADRLGRPRLLALCYAGMALTSLGILFTHSLPPFAVYRFIAGLCASSMIPLAVTIASETAPKRLRSTFSGITVSGTMLGSLLGSFMQGFLLEQYGWHSAFWIATLLPAIMLPLLVLLPDSLRSLAARDPQDPRIPVLARRMAPAGQAVPALYIAPRDSQERPRAPVAAILGNGQWKRTFLYWLAAIGSFVYMTMGQWHTAVYKNVLGLPYTGIAALGVAATAAGAIGMFFIGFLIDRFGFPRVMVSTFLLAALGCVLTGLVAPSPLMFATVAMTAMFQHGGVASVAALGAALYPPASRATGVGWAYGVGRIASIVAPLYGVWILHEAFDFRTISTFNGVPLAVTGLATLALMKIYGEHMSKQKIARH